LKTNKKNVATAFHLLIREHTDNEKNCQFPASRNRSQKCYQADLTDALTSPDCAISSDDWSHFNFVSGMYGAQEKIDKRAARYDDWPAVSEEVLLSMALEALNKLLA